MRNGPELRLCEASAAAVLVGSARAGAQSCRWPAAGLGRAAEGTAGGRSGAAVGWLGGHGVALGVAADKCTAAVCCTTAEGQLKDS